MVADGTHGMPARRGQRGARYPRGWEVTSEEYDHVLVRLPPDVTRVTASMRLSLEAEFGGWELSRVRLYTDGTRKVLLRRRKPPRDRRHGAGARRDSDDAHAC